MARGVSSRSEALDHGNYAGRRFGAWRSIHPEPGDRKTRAATKGFPLLSDIRFASRALALIAAAEQAVFNPGGR
jgi:hypothetical protein